MGQKRIEDAIVGEVDPLGIVGNTTAAEILNINKTWIAKTLSRGLRAETRTVGVLVDPKTGVVRAQRELLGGREQWGWAVEHVAQVRAARLADERKLAADEKRREAMRARA